MNASKTKRPIHYDPKKPVYGVRESELNQIENSYSPVWKDFCIVCLSIFVPTGLNAGSEISGQSCFEITLSIFLNSLFASVCLFLSIAFGIAWYRGEDSRKTVVSRIRDKPKQEFQISESSRDLTREAGQSSSGSDPSEDFAIDPDSF